MNPWKGKTIGTIPIHFARFNLSSNCLKTSSTPPPPLRERFELVVDVRHSDWKGERMNERWKILLLPRFNLLIFVLIDRINYCSKVVKERKKERQFKTGYIFSIDKRVDNNRLSRIIFCIIVERSNNNNNNNRDVVERYNERNVVLNS